MREKFTLSIVILSLLLAGCGKDDVADLTGEGENNPSREVGFVIGIDTPTRAQTDDNLISAFDQGDEIGIFAVQRTSIGVQAYPSADADANYAHNVKWVRGADGWGPATDADRIYYPQEGVLDFYAYYPYYQGADPTDIKYDASENVCDLMTARTSAVFETYKSIPLNFQHKLVLIQVEVAVVGSRISETSGTMNSVLVDATVDLSAREQADELTPLSKIATIPLTPDGYSVSLRTVVPPQEIMSNKVIFSVRTNSGNVDVISTYTELTGGSARRFPIFSETGGQQADPLAPNCYVIPPGDGMIIPAGKAFAMWEYNEDLASLGHDLDTGDASAVLVWQDVQGLIPSVSVMGSGRNLGIKIPTDGTRGGGNAVVGLKINGEIRWSWHIWVTDFDPDDASLHRYSNGFTFLDRNVGALNATVDDPGSVGVYFQWGRKDPHCSIYGFEADDRYRDLYDVNGAKITQMLMETGPDPVENFYMTVTVPSVFLWNTIYGSYGDNISYDWYTHEKNVWSDRWNDAQDNKTPYDPCPEGWRVPFGRGEQHPFYEICDNWWNYLEEPVFNEHGVTFESLGFFPFGHIRHQTDWLIYGLMRGYYWTANTEGDSLSFAFGDNYASSVFLDGWDESYGSDPVLETSLGRGSATPIRCIKE